MEATKARWQLQLCVAKAEKKLPEDSSKKRHRGGGVTKGNDVEEKAWCITDGNKVMRLHFLGFVEDSGPYDGGGCVWSFLEKKGPKYILYSAKKKLREGGDDFDWNIDYELEIENYNSSSSCLTLPNGDAGEASSSTVLVNSKVLDHFVNMGFSREMVSKVIQEYGEENEDKLLEELLSYKRLRCRCNFHALQFVPIIQAAYALLLKRFREHSGEEERKELEAYREIHVPTLSLLKWTTKLAALDFIGCIASDAFAMTNSGSQLSSLVSRY
ncbi:hypothetical protein JHK87_001205 [Glycine soja]|nr:hypothetical protein JHK87_001205 [Glycine soja]